ncbi:hypothetical protein RB594_000330 [Gaeumannomyces avenae]
MITFTPNCTFPTASLGFIQAPPIRGTMEIVWSCLSIVFLCTWSILHLNVPVQHRPEDWRQRLMWKLARFGKKLKWMVVTILAPEVLLGVVSNNFLSVHKNTPKLQKLAKAEGIPWPNTHSWFANQGGFHVHFPRELHDFIDRVAATDPRSNIDESAIELAELNPTEGYVMDPPNDSATPYINKRWRKHFGRRERAVRRYGPLPKTLLIKNFCAYFKKKVHSLQAEKSDEDTDIWLHHLTDTWAADSWQLLFLRSNDIIKKLPNVGKEELEDRNKSDAVVKLLAIIQICWMCTQLVARAMRGLPCTSLEVAAVAFAASSLVTYLLEWSSVQDPALPVYLEASRLPTEEEFSWLLANFSAKLGSGLSPSGPGFKNSQQHTWTSKSHIAHMYTAVFMGIGGVLFGGIHLVAWNFVFPTPLEQSLWRASALLTTFIPVAGLLGVLTILWIGNWFDAFEKAVSLAEGFTFFF